jgi:chemotaxis protein methyltransferase CheR
MDKNQLSAQTLKKDISRHNLVTDGVFKECQLILCRNVLIYFNEDLQNKVLEHKVYQYMVLALGNKETLLFSPFMINLKL